MVPCGRSDLPGYDTVKLYCPNCNDIYTPPSSRFQGVDGMDLTYDQFYLHGSRHVPQVLSLALRSPISSSSVTVNLHPHRSGSPSHPPCSLPAPHKKSYLSSHLS